jgi:hypothetical protein
MSGGKGGSQTTQVQVPKYIEDASRANLAQARDISRIGFVPYFGPEVAAFDPSQVQAMQAAQDQAAAFGLAPSMNVSASLPQAQDFGGGMMGFSSAPLYEQAVAELQARRPGQYRQIMKNFVDPYDRPTPASTRPTRGMNIISTPMVYGGYDLGPDIEEALRMADEATYATAPVISPPTPMAAPISQPMAAPISQPVVIPTPVTTNKTATRALSNYSDYFGY